MLARYYYDVFCDKLEKAGLGREPYEGAREYLARVIALFPEAGKKAATIIGDYHDLRYGDEGDEERKKQFVRCVKHFKIKRKTL